MYNVNINYSVDSTNTPIYKGLLYIYIYDTILQQLHIINFLFLFLSMTQIFASISSKWCSAELRYGLYGVTLLEVETCSSSTLWYFYAYNTF